MSSPVSSILGEQGQQQNLILNHGPDLQSPSGPTGAKKNKGFSDTPAPESDFKHR
jgi:hypothetical protein